LESPEREREEPSYIERRGRVEPEQRGVVEWAGGTGLELDANAGDVELEGVSANGEQTEAIVVGEERAGLRSKNGKRERQ
jgi:hypothetical protein